MGRGEPPVEQGYVDGRKNFVERMGRHFALREITYLREWGEQLLVLLLLGAAFGWIGPFGTFQDLTVPRRLAYWVVAFLLIGSIHSLTMRSLARAEPSAAWPVPVQAIVGALIMAVPSSFVVIALEAIFRHTPALTPSNLARIYVSVAVVMLVIAIPWALIRRYRAREAKIITVEPSAPPAAIEAPARESRFLERLPPKLGTELLCIATEDHYLRVTTKLGNDLILFRLSDAIVELDPRLGQQVHRSYWVAREAVSSVERGGQRTMLVLVNGSKVPVSRTFLPALREAGWLEG